MFAHRDMNAEGRQRFQYFTKVQYTDADRFCDIAASISEKTSIKESATIGRAPLPPLNAGGDSDHGKIPCRAGG